MNLHSHRRLIGSILAMLCISVTSHCQESNYWLTQVGARSTMLCGAVVGSVRDNSAIYYNPGAQAFITNSSLSVVGNIYFHDYLEMENAAGDGLNLYGNNLDAYPQIISGVIKNPKRPALTINYSFFNRHLSKINSRAKNTMYYDVYEDIPGDELYNGIFEYDDRTREDWLGAGYGYRLGDHFGIGVSFFITFRSQSNRQFLDISILDNEQEPAIAQLNGSFIYNVNLSYTSIGFQPKIGYAFDYDKFKFGGSLTFPRLPVYFASQANFLRSTESSIPPVSESIHKVSYYQNRIDAFYKSPWIVDVGGGYDLDNHKFYVTLAYFSGIEKYNLIKSEPPPAGSIDEVLAPTRENYEIVYIAQKAVLNAAIGYELRLGERFNLLTGFSTDFNNFDSMDMDLDLDYTPNYTRWNIYHLSGGIELETERISLTLGFNIAVGGSNNQLQMFNMSSPGINNNLLGERNSNVNNRYIRTSLVVGFVYYFPGTEPDDN